MGTMKRVQEYMADLKMQDMFDVGNTKNTKNVHKSVSNCQNVRTFLIDNEHLEEDKDKLVKQIVHFLIIDCYHMMRYILVNYVILLSKLEEKDRIKLQNEAQTLLKKDKENTNPLSEGTPHIDSFIQEVFRLYPPISSVSGKASTDFSVASYRGHFRIRKGDLIHGRIDQGMRDARVYLEPNSIMINRHTDMNFENNIISKFIIKDARNRPESVRFVTSLLRMLAAYFIFCRVTWREEPVWTGRYPDRVIASDRVVKVAEFSVDRNTGK